MSDWELAQLNIATLLAPIDSPTLADFVSELDRINAIAENSSGFVWRSQSENGNATDMANDFGDDVVANLSVWRSVDELHNYIFRTAHAQMMSRRKQWFKMMRETYAVLWWVPLGHRPTLSEARMKLELLRSRGPTPAAFTFRETYPKPSQS